MGNLPEVVLFSAFILSPVPNTYELGWRLDKDIFGMHQKFLIRCFTCMAPHK